MMDAENLTESSAHIQPKQLSHRKPKKMKDVRVSLTVMKISEPHSSLTETENPLTHISSHKFDNTVDSVGPVSQELSSFDESICQNNAAELTHAIIKESSEMSATDLSSNQIIFSPEISDHSGFEKEYPIAVVDNRKNNPINDSILEIFHMIPLNQSNLQNSDINSSEYPLNSSLFDKDILLSSANLLTSTPEALTNYNPGNLIENNNNSMDSSTNYVNRNSNEKNCNSTNTFTKDDTGNLNRDINNLMNSCTTYVDGNLNEENHNLMATFTKDDTGNLNENNNNLLDFSTTDINGNSNEKNYHFTDTFTKYDSENSNANNNNSMDKGTKLVIKAHGLSEESHMNAEESNDADCDDLEYEPSEKSTRDSESDVENDDDRIGIDSQNENSPENGHNITDTLNVSVALQLPGSSICVQDEMHVEKSRGRSGDKKYNFCVYCHKKQFKIARHLELKHYKEQEVRKFIDLPKNSAERRKIIGVIRKKGNFLFNTQTIYNDGELIVSRRPRVTHDKSAGAFKVCASCKAYFSVKSLRMHFAKCTGRSSKKNRMVMVMSKQVVAQVHPKASLTVINKIFPRLREDETVRAIRYDELVIIYANKMCEKYEMYRDFTMIRQRMRLLGRFLLMMKSLNKEITDLTSVYDPKFVDDTLRAIVAEAKVTSAERDQMTPAVASALGTLLKLCGTILVNESIKKHDDVKKKNAKDFLKLLAQELSISINRRVSEFQTQQQRRKKIELPLMEDVQKLCKFLQEVRDKAYEELKRTFSEATWMTLAEATLTSLQVFNRRRAGEIERTEIEDFKSYQSLDSDTNKDLYESLSQKNQTVAKKYTRFSIRGKKNRPVAVLLNNDIFRCIELLLNHREDMKISSKNIYVFGIPGKILSSYKHLDACALMRKFSVQCGATFPERLRGTKLRKHIATICVTMNLTDNQISDLASYMGHAEKIHKDIYRQPVVSREILQMSKLLEIAQGAHDDDDDAASSEEEAEFQPDIQSNDTECQGDSQDLQKADHLKSNNNAARRVRFSKLTYKIVFRTPILIS